MVDEIIVGFEDAVGEPVVAHELPDVLDRVELWALRRQHDQGCTLALRRADCTEDVGGSGPLVPRCAWTGAALGPAAGDLVLLADAGLVGEPDFYRVAVKRLLARNCLQARGEVFLKSSIAPSACT